MNHAEALRLVRGKSGRSIRKVGNNTWAEIIPNVDVVITLHRTQIVTIHADNTHTLNSGGWRTSTTKDRINKFSPARLYQHKHEWYVMVEGKTVDFYDNMTV